ncbi:16S rRNA (cytosine(967)-C(5))-methyltransferase [PVC group bacterium (ex Bugula neritina AB1)]|nr:16S rRNA (cytosine(967)-C(5))-methyltransferase [PVC group bacterium (ex Bugula neritina AB1)]
MNTRALALDLLEKWEKTDQFLAQILDSCCKQKKLNEKDRAFLQELVYGVLRWRPWLDSVIKKSVKDPQKKMSSLIKNVLRLGIYQMVFLEKVPIYASINETLNLLRCRVKRGFVNAVLRNYDRSVGEYKLPSSEEGIPAKIKDYLSRECPKVDLTPVWESIQKKPLIYARWNPLTGTRDVLEAIWQQENRKYQCVNESQGIYHLEKIETNVETWPSFQKGLFTIQDVYASSVVSHLDVKEHHKVLDACAAPGGKSFQIATYLKNADQLVALDVSKKRLDNLKKAALRLKVDNIKLVEGDAKKHVFLEKFDRILLDVPCSNLGVLNRRLDVRFRFSQKQQNSLIGIQREILENMSSFVKQDGIMVYSTCTLSRKENQDQVRAFLKKNPNFFCSYQALNIPGHEKGDGGYVAILHRSS